MSDPSPNKREILHTIRHLVDAALICDGGGEVQVAGIRAELAKYSELDVHMDAKETT